MRKVKLKLSLDPHPFHCDEYNIRLVGWMASSRNLQELTLCFPTSHMTPRDKTWVILCFRGVPAMRHISNFRGVKVLFEADRESGVFMPELQDWLKDCMAQAKQNKGMTVYEGMATIGDIQAHIEQEVEGFSRKVDEVMSQKREVGSQKRKASELEVRGSNRV